MTKKKRKALKTWILVFIISFIVLYVCIYILPRVSDIFVSTYIAEYANVEIGSDRQMVFVRDEKVYTAQSSGTLDKIVKQGNLKRRGSRIVTVGTQNYYSEKKGIISYYYDGYEDRITPKNLTSLTEDWLGKFTGGDYNLVNIKQGQVSSGQQIFKIVDNEQWYLVFWVEKDEENTFEKGKKVSVVFSDGVKLPMEVYSLDAQGEKIQVVLDSNRYYKNFDSLRTDKCRIITSNYDGIILETDSIVEKDGQKGVYVVDKYNNSNFTPIKILATDNDTTVVEKNYYYDADGTRRETVKSYDEILRTDGKDEVKGSE